MMPPHLRRVATLPCELLVSEFQHALSRFVLLCYQFIRLKVKVKVVYSLPLTGDTFQSYRPLPAIYINKRVLLYGGESSRSKTAVLKAQTVTAWGARNFCPKIYVWKMNKISELYTIRARKYIYLNFFGAKCLHAPSPTPMYLGCGLVYLHQICQSDRGNFGVKCGIRQSSWRRPGGGLHSLSAV